MVGVHGDVEHTDIPSGWTCQETRVRPEAWNRTETQLFFRMYSDNDFLRPSVNECSMLVPKARGSSLTSQSSAEQPSGSVEKVMEANYLRGMGWLGYYSFRGGPHFAPQSMKILLRLDCPRLLGPSH